MYAFKSKLILNFLRLVFKSEKQVLNAVVYVVREKELDDIKYVKVVLK